MYDEKKIKAELLNIINENTSLNIDDKTMWRSIITKLADRQETILNEIASRISSPVKYKNTVYCGCSDLKQNQLGDNWHYMSVADDFTNEDFLGIKTDKEQSDSRMKKDGKWNIIGIGYLDGEYEEITALCGKHRLYRGTTAVGSFEYALVLKPVLINKEKMLHQIALQYPSEFIFPYSPMLRRLVYIETPYELGNEAKTIDLQLTRNRLENLHCDWRSVWNIDEKDSLIPIQRGETFRYEMQPNEYIISYNRANVMTKYMYDQENNARYIEASTNNCQRPDNTFTKISINQIGNKNQFAPPHFYLNVYDINFEKEQLIDRIYSKADLTLYLQSFRLFVQFKEASPRYVEGLKICAYELGFEYPQPTEYFKFSQRPTLYVIFENDHKPFLFDRIIYVIHLLQYKFPEYLWKGGYLNE